MCEPATLAIAGLAASAIGTGVGVMGSMQQAGAQKAQAQYTAQVAQNNATVARQQAVTMQNAADVRAQQDQRAGDVRLGAQRAAIGASGVGLDSGSALDVTGATAQNTTLAANSDRYNGMLQAYGYQNQAANFTGQAGMATAAGQNAGEAGTINAFSTALGGASQVAGKWAGWSRPSSGYGPGSY